MLSVTKRFEISYSHFLPNHKGKCKELHGHNAIVEVEIRGDADEETGMVVDFGDLKWRCKTDILDKLDHKHLNKILPEYYQPPTAENIILWVRNRLKEIYGSKLYRIRLYETRDNYAEWKDEG